MKNWTNTIWERIKTFFSNIKYKSIAKGARVTYGVVWNLLLIFTIVFILGGAFAGGIGAGYFASLVKDQKVLAKDDMLKNIHQYEETSSVYFADNIELGKLRTDIDREEIKISEISDYLKKALVATEDEYFYEHKGVVPKALFRAVFQEFTNSSVQSGGSTLTQQLIKNQILTNEVSFERKAKEVLLALRLERFMDKDEILEAYLNVSTFGRNSSGQNVGGVQAAAKGIFGKDAKDLSLPQAAFIAGLPQSPFRYTPFTNQGEVKEPELLEPGLNRMKTVLNRMKKEGYISEKEYKEAINYDITADFIAKQPRAYEKYPDVTDEIERRTRDIFIEMLAKEDGHSKEDLSKDDDLYNKYYVLADREMRQGGYKIHSTINQKLFDAMRKAKNEYDNYGPTLVRSVENKETGEMEEVPDPVQIGAMLFENKTGKILSFVSGREIENANSSWNYATLSQRQNGSTMKPLLVYGPAIELGKSAPGAVIADLPYTFPGGWTPNNYVPRKYYGLVSAREALKHSHNASAAITYYKIMNDNPTQYLEKMGFEHLTETDKSIHSIALGATQKGVTVEENTNAFTTFANGGQFKDGYMIEKITDHDGNVVYEHKEEPVDVFSPQTAYLMTDMLRDVFRSGTAHTVPGMLKFSDDWAGKTGTTNDFKDSWLVGFNPNVTLGTWIGYESGTSLRAATRVSDAQRNYQIWAKLMNAAYDAEPEIVKSGERFKMPGGIVSRSYCASSGMLPSEACQKAGLVRTDIFNAKYVPSKTDDSLSPGGRYILANGKKYSALSSTPKEFTKEGLVVNPEFLKQMTLGLVRDYSQLIPQNSGWKNLIVADAKLEDDGKAPAAVKASLAGDTIKWSASSSKDVVGYRVYSEAGKKIASIVSDETFAHKVGKGKFYVVAVDVAGKESQPSNQVGEEEKKEEESTEVTKPNDSEKEQTNNGQKEEGKNNQPNKDKDQKENKQPEKEKPKDE